MTEIERGELRDEDLIVEAWRGLGEGRGGGGIGEADDQIGEADDQEAGVGGQGEGKEVREESAGREDGLIFEVAAIMDALARHMLGSSDAERTRGVLERRNDPVPSLPQDPTDSNRTCYSPTPSPHPASDT